MAKVTGTSDKDQRFREAERKRVERLKNKDAKSEKARWESRAHNEGYQESRKAKKRERYASKLFPPPSPSRDIQADVIKGWVNDSQLKYLEERGCAVCGLLYPKAELDDLTKYDLNLNLLCVEGITRKERHTSADPIEQIPGPILTGDRKSVCEKCLECLKKNDLPRAALANGLWIGDVPDELKGLTWIEQRLISRIVYNFCVIRVFTGAMKMRANAITHAMPMPKVYQALPPKREDFEELLAFFWISPYGPEEGKDDKFKKRFEKTPFIVRRNKVKIALEWLKLNHADYYDLEISDENLKTYKDGDIPIRIERYKSDEPGNQDPEATAVNETAAEAGTEEDECPFTINTLTVDQFNDQLDPSKPYDSTHKFIRSRALKHFKDDKQFVLGLGHAKEPENIYDNEQLYPRMFPCLFPYGFGGFKNKRQSYPVAEDTHKMNLLMYHDKRFQNDSAFCLIAFNHEQRKNSATGAHILANRANLANIADRVLNLNKGVLDDLINRLQEGHVTPATQEEKDCFALLSDIDVVNSHVEGSITSKKTMRSQVWAMTNYLGAPSWFITFAPADINHPIALYYADTKETYYPELMDKKVRTNLMAMNPVAGARFFKLMVDLFIEHVLGVEADHPGLYGKTAGYYGTVEQQGRLTLHLHMLLWLKNALSPQEIRDRLLDKSSTFQEHLIQYLENVRKGEFMSHSMSELTQLDKDIEADPYYKDPLLDLPEMPIDPCAAECNKCEQCSRSTAWWQKYEAVVDRIVFKSNVHDCDKNVGCKVKVKVGKTLVQTCKGRFPRDTFTTTLVDQESGAINQRKGEAYLNWYTPALTYLMRCNTDVTSLLSGTAIKSVIAYTTDYITKPGLKTYTIFQAVKNVFRYNTEMLNKSDLDKQTKARRVVLKIVNALTGKSEIGAPMAAMYLLRHPDHYTSHLFQCFYWQSFAKYVEQSMPSLTSDLGAETKDEMVPLWKRKDVDEVKGVSRVEDYVHRPTQCENLSLYDWIRLSKKEPIPKSILKNLKTGNEYVVQKIVAHQWIKSRVRFLVEWSAGDQTWESYTNCSHLQALDEYLCSQKVSSWRELAHDNLSQPPENDKVADEPDVEEYNEYEPNEELDCELDNKELTEEQNDLNEGEGEDVTMGVDPGTYFFAQTHPQSTTHRIRILKESKCLVPDFRPLTLPRKDKGNYEDYCMVMMMLFKPWREPTVLQAGQPTWEEAFKGHVFTPRQLQLMQFFHLRYECLDARDDFSTRRKAGLLNANDIPILMNEKFLDNLDDLAELDEQEQYNDNLKQEEDQQRAEELAIEYRQMNLGAEKRLKQMIAAHFFYENAGGLTKLDELQPHGVESEETGGDLNGSEWKNILVQRRREILDQRKMQAMKGNTAEHRGTLPENREADNVKIVNSDYLTKAYKAGSPESATLIDNCVKEFSLNLEQERAFRIIANHATDRRHPQLKMYLGGMAGTGKSQVIKALMTFFKQRNEDYRLRCVAPTGSAAALIDGSTYHSLLAIGRQDRDSDRIPMSAVSEVQQNLLNVDYLFMDEVSMLDCFHLYDISNRMCQGTNKDDPFGGINVIFAGDFAQLPPINGQALYHCDAPSVVHTTNSGGIQKQAIGKTLWHQFTTVVLLRQNMRQTSQSPQDIAFRTCLENLRYKACTNKDIELLNSRKLELDTDLSLKEPQFRNISVITRWNSTRDAINRLGVERFAQDTGQHLYHFYSRDSWRSVDDTSGQHRSRRKTTKNPSRKANLIARPIQETLWELSHQSTENHPGILSVCLGLPVMIKQNVATECAVTNGAEGVVVGWKAKKGNNQKPMLDTLFVRLTSPPRPIQLPGLDINVVPVSAQVRSITALLNNGDTRYITRTQIPVIPNFAMTDYNSQGRTRPFNVCDIKESPNFQAVYTSLSRGTTYEGTGIVRSFTPENLRGGISGHLRQEFRELELLDEITCLQYEGTLPESVCGDTRAYLISAFRKWKGLAFVPSAMPKTLKWSNTDPLPLQPLVEEPKWITMEQFKREEREKVKQAKVTGKDSKPRVLNLVNYVPAKGSQPLDQINNKSLNALTLINTEATQPKKLEKRKSAGDMIAIDCKRKTKHARLTEPSIHSTEHSLSPIGLKWDARNYSCAYDSLLTILKSYYEQCSLIDQAEFAQGNIYTSLLCKMLGQMYDKNMTFEKTREAMRLILHNKDPVAFNLTGTQGTDIYILCQTVLSNLTGTAIWKYKCKNCKLDFRSRTKPDPFLCLEGSSLPSSMGKSRLTTTPISSWLTYTLSSKSNQKCTTCNQDLTCRLVLSELPYFLLISLQYDNRIKPAWDFKICIGDTAYRLIGLIYFGNFHFTCRLVQENGAVWYHDGMRTGTQCKYEAPVSSFTPRKFATAHNKKCILGMYARIHS